MVWTVKKGHLYLVGVPIGNDEDITYRAVRTLQNVDVIAAEDTRKAQRLLSTWDIRPSELISHGPHNEHASTKGVLSMLEAGKSVALITDSGMPAVSDPGFLLSRTVLEMGIPMEVLPGVSAAMTAVVTSGLPCERFSFQGFLPRKVGERNKRLEDLKLHSETLVFYEAPHRVLETLEAMINTFGAGRKATLCRELTKIYEEIIRTTLEDIYTSLKEREKILGEICLVVEGATKEDISEGDLDDAIRSLLHEGLSVKDISAELAGRFGMHKKEIYQRALEVKAEL